VADEPPGARVAVRLSARERIERLLDPGSFTELDAHSRAARNGHADQPRPVGDAVITGFGTVDGRKVCVFSQDPTVLGGSLGEVMARKIGKVMDLALKVGCPIVGINDSGGARIQDGVAALVAYGDIFLRNVACSAVVPQLSLIMGTCAGGAVYSPALTDLVFMVRGGSHMFVTGPEVIRHVTGAETSFEELGGADTHAVRSGVAHFAADDEEECLEQARLVLAHLPSNNRSRAPREDTGDDPQRLTPELDAIVPDARGRGYDMRNVVDAVLDVDSLVEVHRDFAPNLIVAFGRLDGHAVGVLANQPLHRSGCLDIDACVKAARFVRLCDAYHLPLISFCDVPGLLPGVDQELGGIIRHGAKLVYALTEATVPRMTVVTRKAYGGAYMVGARTLNADFSVGWPTAEVAVMGADAAVSILDRRALAAAEDPAALRAERAAAYGAEHCNPYRAAERGWLDDVIVPSETRPVLIRALSALLTKHVPEPPRRHGHIPL
jgi:propionyl-CoA carboxylase beta chain